MEVHNAYVTLFKLYNEIHRQELLGFSVACK